MRLPAGFHAFSVVSKTYRLYARALLPWHARTRKMMHSKSFTYRRHWPCVLVLPLLLGCSEEVGHPNGAGGTSGGAEDAGADASVPGTPLTVDVPETGRVFIDLAKPSVISPAMGGDSTDWHMAMGGNDVFTNSGPSGPGNGSAFGPLDPIEYFGLGEPIVPFVTPDTTGGAFIDWWKYDNTAHVIWSRFHIYGIKDKDRYWKVQVLSFYGEQQGAPVSALYSVRFAELTASGAGPTQTLTNIDATAGGPSPPDTMPSDCLDLQSGTLMSLTPPDALKSTAWHLCFRRSEIAVNGDAGGPRGVLAVDLDADKTASETLDEVKQKTADSELPRFDSIDYAALSAPGLNYKGDRIVTAFSDMWIDEKANPRAPKDAAWYVIGPDGTSKFVLRFESFEGATALTPGKVTMRVKALP